MGELSGNSSQSDEPCMSFTTFDRVPVAILIFISGVLGATELWVNGPTGGVWLSPLYARRLGSDLIELQRQRAKDGHTGAVM